MQRNATQAERLAHLGLSPEPLDAEALFWSKPGQQHECRPGAKAQVDAQTAAGGDQALSKVEQLLGARMKEALSAGIRDACRQVAQVRGQIKVTCYNSYLCFPVMVPRILLTVTAVDAGLDLGH